MFSSHGSLLTIAIYHHEETTLIKLTHYDETKKMAHDQGWVVKTTAGLKQLNSPDQYAKKWSILVNTKLSGRLKFLNDRFGSGLRYLVRFYLLKKIKKKYCFIPD